MPLRDRDRRSGGRMRRNDGPSSLRIVAAFAVLGLLLGGGVWLYVKGRSSSVAIDDKSLCRTSRAPSAVTVILLDMSDRLSEPQRMAVHNELYRARQRVPRFGLIEAYAVDPSGRRLIEPVIQICNPGTGADLNHLYQNPELARRRWERFDSDLSQKLDELTERPSGNKSPIFEAIQSAALRTFNRPDLDGVPKELLVVSDLMQNVPGKLSLYQEHPNFKAFKKSTYFANIRADLGGVSTQVLMLVRPSVQSDALWLVSFWESYFAAQGAHIESIQPVYGEQ